MFEAARWWWCVSRLCVIKHGTDAPCVDVSRGPLAEMVLAALALPSDMQQIAHIEFADDTGTVRLDWPEIQKLSVDPDFPTII